MHNANNPNEMNIRHLIIAEIASILLFALAGTTKARFTNPCIDKPNNDAQWLCVYTSPDLYVGGAIGLLFPMALLIAVFAFKTTKEAVGNCANSCENKVSECCNSLTDFFKSSEGNSSNNTLSLNTDGHYQNIA